MNTTLPQILEDALEIKSMKLDLGRMFAFDAALGFPSRRFDSIHVAGTNGKGSVATKIAHAFYGKKKVGLFTSPHIDCYRERVQINGIPIPEEVAQRLLTEIASQLSDRASYFELLTLLAFVYFAEEKVDLAVLEVGMGGRLDATNIVKPLLSVITSIGLDHTQYLGNTIEEIAFEKGGIIKPGVPVVVGPHACFYPKSDLLYEVKGNFLHYEEENRAIAKKGLQILGVEYSDLSVVPPCRFERMGKYLLDVAHNPDGLKRTFDRIAIEHPGKKVGVVAAFSADKDIESCLEMIQNRAQSFQLAKIDHPRIHPFSRAISLREALNKIQTEDLVLICGTFFMMAEARAILKKELGGGSAIYDDKPAIS